MVSRKPRGKFCKLGSRRSWEGEATAELGAGAWGSSELISFPQALMLTSKCPSRDDGWPLSAGASLKLNHSHPSRRLGAK